MLTGETIQQVFLESAEDWGLTVAYAVTGSVESAERVVAEAVVVMAASSIADRSRPALQVRFARAVLEASKGHAFRAPAGEAYFRLAPLSRAIVALKTKARLSLAQISEVTGRPVPEIEAQLESARLSYTDGRPWLEKSPALITSGAHWAPECPYWRGTAPRSDSDQADIQTLFAKYLEGDLHPNVATGLHMHFNVCAACRANLAHFKTTHAEWTRRVPDVTATPRFLKRIDRYGSEMAMRRLEPRVTPWPALRRMLRDRKVWLALISAAAALMLLYR